MPRQSNRATARKSFLRQPYAGFLIALGILALVFLVPYSLSRLFPNPNLYNQNKDALRQAAQNVLDSANFAGSVVFNQVRDKGCDDRNAGFGETYYHCELLGQKYFEADGDVGQTLIAADQVLTQNGFKKQGSSSELTTGKAPAQQLEYISNQPTGPVKVLLGYYKDAQHRTDFGPLSDLITQGKLSTPKDDKFFFGIYLMPTYFSCRNGNTLLMQTCPAMPAPLLIP